MRRSFLLSTVALSSLIAAASAQTSSPSGAAASPASPPAAATAQFQSPADNTNGCPVDFTVARRSATELLRASDRAQRDAQGIKVSLQPISGQQIRSADIVVHATTGGPGLLPLRQPTDSAQTNRTFHIDHGRAGTLEKSLVLERVNTVTSADLVALRFADGSIWHADAAEPCRAVPSLFLPITAAAR